MTGYREKELMEAANLLLDARRTHTPIADLPLELQPKLLRVLQERRIERVGSADPIEIDVRLIAATNRPLENMVQQGKFREDLYHRLSVVPIRVPPLAERRDDIPHLIEYFMEQISLATGLPQVAAASARDGYASSCPAGCAPARSRAR